MLNLAQSMFQKKDQSGEIAPVINFPKPSLIQEAIVDTRKEDGFTPLPNFICDEGYLAALSGDAIKCLVFLNRYIDGFHLDEKSMGEALVMKITGIKDKRTIRKYMAELAKYRLVNIHRENGKSNVYSITFDQRLPVKPVTYDATGSTKPDTQHATGKNLKPVALNVATPYAPVTCDATTPVTQHAPATSDMACHSVKEIDLKENIKINNSNNPPANFEPQNRPMLQFVEYHPEDKKIYSLRELTRTYPAQSDFTAQAKVSFPKLTDDEIWQKLCDIAQWSVDQPARTAQKWMSTWLTSCKNIGEKKPAQPKAKAKQPEKKKYHRYGQGVINP